jgi:hypothetical protein
MDKQILEVGWEWGGGIITVAIDMIRTDLLSHSREGRVGQGRNKIREEEERRRRV